MKLPGISLCGSWFRTVAEGSLSLISNSFFLPEELSFKGYFPTAFRVSDCLEEGECWLGTVEEKRFERRKNKNESEREGEKQVQRCREPGRESKQRAGSGQPCPPRAQYAWLFSFSFFLNPGFSSVGFPLSALECPTGHPVSESSLCSSASAPQRAPGAWRRGARVPPAKLFLRAAPRNAGVADH